MYALLDGKGRILLRTEPLEQEILYGTLSVGGRGTLYGRICNLVPGGVFPLLAAGYLLFLFPYGLLLRRRDSASPEI